MKRNDTYIEGVLIMELATMVVAIALAFLASSLSTYSSQAIQTIVEFVIISTVVVWFWWSYVVERIEYPFKTFKFPFYDVLILITISLIACVYKIGGIMYIAGLLSFLMFFWSLMLIGIKNEYIDSINEIERKIFNFEIRSRIIITLVSAFTVIVAYFSIFYGIIVFTFVIVIIIFGYLRKINLIKLKQT